ncbi:hypothetical protein [Galactobacter caseinivorans]|uniref:Camelysin metallo-endopeptidase n=1 Tax=Galactobacter caseinivorans TaxID=2676123 RepID=A0A496PFC0_9MICC|nr:hypothetical protein [Galactobacter caseinivorans]RKW69409.1 hypothetical protein DWQ67_13375 [Galactobacter caseinivorans]
MSGRHAAKKISGDRKYRQDRRRLRRLIVGTALVAACTVVGISAAGGSYALLNAGTRLPGATVQAGSMDLRVNGAGTAGLGSVSLTPGTSRAVAFQVSNLGDVAATLGASMSAASSQAINDYTFARLTPVASAGACTTGLGGTRAKIDGYTAANLDALAAGQSKFYCVEFSLDPATPASQSGQGVSVTIKLTTQQKP